ncbi:MAG: 3D domain-containing protein [Sporomusaceae bacterium]|nr:3D domain-containing protein [Sporomusaceae bacterium]
MSDAKPIFSAMGRKRLAVFLMLIITSLLATGFVWSYKNVTITVDNKQLAVTTYHSNVQDVLRQAKVVVEPSDEVRLSTEKLVSGTNIHVYRAIPLQVIYRGETTQVVSGKPTVREVVSSLGIPLEQVQISPQPDSLPTAGMTITVTVLSEKVVTEQVAAPIPVVRQGDATLEKGIEKVESDGSQGIKEMTVRQHFTDGVMTKSEVVSEKILVPPQPQVIRVGMRDTVPTSRGDLRFRRIAYMEATAYTPYDGGGSGITASGIAARRGIVAVDPSVIPLGTRLYIPGYGLALAADTGGAIVGDRIDLCMEDYGSAEGFGRRTVKVYVLGE